MVSSGSSAPPSVDRGPWSLSVGIPARVVRDRLAPLWARNLAISGSAVLAVLWLSLVALASHQQWAEPASRRRPSASRAAIFRRRCGRRLRTGRSAELQDAFITMAANLRATRDALDHQVEQERKMREMLQSLQRQVVRQERLAAVGLLVSGVAHELNNPLQAILGTAELLERYPNVDAECSKRSRCSRRKAAGRAKSSATCRGSAASRSGPPTLVDLRTVIAEVVQLRRHDLEESSITIDVEASGSQEGLRERHRARAGHAQFRHQRAAGDRVGGTQGRPHPAPPVRRRPEDTARSPGRRTRRVARARAEAVPAVLHHQAGRQGDRARALRELRHHRLRMAV